MLILIQHSEMIYRYIEFSPVSFLWPVSALLSSTNIKKCRALGLGRKETHFLTPFEVFGQLKNTHPMTDTQQSWNNQIFIKPHCHIEMHKYSGILWIWQVFTLRWTCVKMYCINIEDFLALISHRCFELCIALCLRVWGNVCKLNGKVLVICFPTICCFLTMYLNMPFLFRFF